MDTVASRTEPRQGRDAGAKRQVVHGVILAGAHPWAERVLERAVCRPLVPITSRPLICHALDWLRSGDIRAASICANSDTVLLRRRLRDGAGLGVELDYHEDVMPRGPAGCARDVAASSQAQVFVVLEGSILPRLDLEHLLKTHESSGAILTVVVRQAQGMCSGGRRALEPVGIYVFSRAAFKHVPEHGYHDIKETLVPHLHAAGEFVDTYVVDHAAAASVTGLSSYLAVSELMVEQLLCDQALESEYLRMGEARVHVSVRMAGSVRLVGPVLIESGCRLEPGALVVGPATIGTGCTIGRNAVVTRSVLWSRCEIRSGAILDHCIVTDTAVVEPGSRLRNAMVAPVRRKPLLQRLLGIERAAAPPTVRGQRERVPAADSEPARVARRSGRADDRPLREAMRRPRELRDIAPDGLET